MNKDYEWEYECEECEGTFIIKPDMNEQILFCPQCSNTTSFKNTFHYVPHEEEEEYLYYDPD